MSLASHSNCYFLGKKHRFRKEAHTFSRLVHPFVTEKEFLLHRFFLTKNSSNWTRPARSGPYISRLRNRVEVVCWNINICLKNNFHLEPRLKFWRKILWLLSCRTWFDCLFNRHFLMCYKPSVPPNSTWNDIIFSLFGNLKDSLQKM